MIELEHVPTDTYESGGFIDSGDKYRMKNILAGRGRSMRTLIQASLMFLTFIKYS